METQNEEDLFSLGITMAGAVSAGCYTAGVMDYLFEILDKWEKAKKNTADPNFRRIPQHSVRIDAMGGASAGGMTTAMSAIYALNGVINPVIEPKELSKNKENILYDSWVLMGEGEDDNESGDKRPLFERLWDTEDLEKGVFGSLLNSKFIDSVANKAFKVDQGINLVDKVGNLPSYISKDIQLLFSHCFLRGIPLDVSFETQISKKGRKSVIPNHSTFEHYIVTQYHLNQGIEPDSSKYLWFNPYDEKHSDLLKLSTISTGAFPIGLAFREFKSGHLTEKYIKTAVKRVVTGDFGYDPDPDHRIDLTYLPENYSSVVVDGGAINNEPYREILSILEHKSNKINDGYPRYGVIMIDPFPDRAQLQGAYARPNDAVDVAQKIIGTLMDQSRIKRREMLETDSSQHFKSIVFPRKWKTDGNGNIIGAPRTIACDSAMAFGGFLDIRFRQHDFFLGRNNARNFVRYFFSFPYNNSDDPEKYDVHPIHRKWTKDMVDTFIFEKNGQFYLPIIPDLHLFDEDGDQRKKQRTHYDVKDLPKYDPEELFRLEKKIQKRLLKILNVIQHRDFTEEIEKANKIELKGLSEKQRNKVENMAKIAAEKNMIADDWIKDKYNKNLLSKLWSFTSRPFVDTGLYFGKNYVAKKMTQAIISAVLKDLAAKDLLEEHG